ncbi:MAG: phytanoyl-CoA dioxygenase family protein [Alphaproteobacteria bacterium]|nr:phytanoyl-CoA dioxygenase family protein [Alphaproteobacteria bacterium]
MNDGNGLGEGLFSAAQLADFERDGCLCVPGFLGPEEVEWVRRASAEVEALPELPGRQLVYWEDSLAEPGTRVRQRIEDIYSHHDGYRAFFDGPKMRGAAGALFGEAAILFKDKINLKLAGGDGFKPHQDQQAGWWDYAGLFITVMVSIDPTTIENGCLEVAAGQHKRGLIGKAWEPMTEADMAGMDFRAYPTEPGDAFFFDSFAPHSSGPNTTDRPRRVLYVTYNRRREGDHRAQYYADKRKSFPPDCEREDGKSYAFRV